MSNTLRKLLTHVLPEDSFSTAVSSQGTLSIESRGGNSNRYLSFIDLNSASVSRTIDVSDWDPMFVLSGFKDENPLIIQFPNPKNPDSKIHHLLDLKTTQLKKENHLTETDFPPIETPVLFNPGDDGFQTIANFLNKEIILGSEYLEQQEAIIFSYYTESGESLQRFLTVIKEGETKLDLVQDEKMKGFGPGSFFTYQNRLIFVVNKRELTIYEI